MSTTDHETFETKMGRVHHYSGRLVIASIATVVVALALGVTTYLAATSPDPEQCRKDIVATFTTALADAHSQAEFDAATTGWENGKNLPDSCKGLTEDEMKAIGQQVLPEIMPLIMAKAFEWSFGDLDAEVQP